MVIGEHRREQEIRMESEGVGNGVESAVRKTGRF